MYATLDKFYLKKKGTSNLIFLNKNSYLAKTMVFVMSISSNGAKFNSITKLHNFSSSTNALGKSSPSLKNTKP